jgi:hypothetical protein
MTENTMPTNTGHQSEPTDSEPAVPQAAQDQAELSDSELQLTQAPSSTTCTAREGSRSSDVEERPSTSGFASENATSQRILSGFFCQLK